MKLNDDSRYNGNADLVSGQNVVRARMTLLVSGQGFVGRGARGLGQRVLVTLAGVRETRSFDTIGHDWTQIKT
ncbi:malate dehydrogenase [Moniliophthora roreri]|nr:malate dehydrogenase [Moniliophthora roreri]